MSLFVVRAFDEVEKLWSKYGSSLNYTCPVQSPKFYNINETVDFFCFCPRKLFDGFIPCPYRLSSSFSFNCEGYCEFRWKLLVGSITGWVLRCLFFNVLTVSWRRILIIHGRGQLPYAWWAKQLTFSSYLNNRGLSFNTNEFKRTLSISAKHSVRKNRSSGWQFRQ